MEHEFTALTENKTWSLVRRDKAQHVIGSRWHFAVKMALMATFGGLKLDLLLRLLAQIFEDQIFETHNQGIEERLK